MSDLHFWFRIRLFFFGILMSNTLPSGLLWQSHCLTLSLPLTTVVIFTFHCHQGIYEPPHDETNKVDVHPTKTQISLGIHPVWSESLLSAWRKLGSLATYWAHSEDSDQTGLMPMLIWVFAGRTATLLVLSCRGSYCPLQIGLHRVLVAVTWRFKGHKLERLQRKQSFSVLYNMKVSLRMKYTVDSKMNSNLWKQQQTHWLVCYLFLAVNMLYMYSSNQALLLGHIIRYPWINNKL